VLLFPYLPLPPPPPTTTSGLRAVADGFPKLRWLNLRNQRLVTDVGVKHLAMGCKELTYVDLSSEEEESLQ